MKNYNGILIIGEQRKNDIHPVTYELLNKAVELVANTKKSITTLILGHKLDVKELCYRGSEKVVYMEDACFIHPEEYLYKMNIVKFIKETKPEIVLIGATNFGRSLAPRLAGALKTGLTADCTELVMNDEQELIQIRPAFSDNILAHIKSVAYPQMATIRYKEFSESDRNIHKPVTVKKMKPYYTHYDKATILDTFIDNDFDITDAEVVVAVGRGLKLKEDFKMFERLAKLLGGEMGATRALVDAGMIDSARQIGYSGNRVKPKLYIACGLSGAPQHIAGMKESDFIIAINNDPSAPIFRFADIGYIGDMYELIPRMIQDLTTGRHKHEEHIDIVIN